MRRKPPTGSLALAALLLGACVPMQESAPNAPHPPTPLAPSAGEVLPQDNLREECTVYGVAWHFAWEQVPGAVRYQVRLEHDGVPMTVYSRVFSTAPEVTVGKCGCFDEPFLTGWDWRVRAENAAGGWGAWSDAVPFSVKPFAGCMRPHEEQ